MKFFKKLIARFRSDVKVERSTDNFKVLDTNILLLDANNIQVLGRSGSIIVLPETVLDEADSKKSGYGELAFQARSVGRLLTAAVPKGKLRIANLVISIMETDGVTVWVVASRKYPDLTKEDRSIVNDRKIIDIASQLAAVKGDEAVTFISNDVMCRLRADSLGLNVGDVKDIEDVTFQFTKGIQVTHECFTGLHGKSIKEIDENYKTEVYNYKFSSPDSAQIKLATIKNGVISVIGKDSEAELRRQDINPANADQLFLSRCIQDTSIDIVVCDAPAGSGKTLVALSNAIRLIGTNSPYNSITYVRASVNDVEAQEEVGFLPGSEADKNAPYLHPLHDSLDYIVRKKYDKGKLRGADLDDKVAEGVEKLTHKCGIVGLTGLGMRGRTFRETVFIIDEIQNMSKPSLQKVMTRIGPSCKVILIGSNNQIDHPYLNKYTNGLSVILDACAKPQKDVTLHAVTLEKIVRGRVAEFSENLFSKSEG